MKIFALSLILLFSVLLLTGCGSSTGSRYEKDEERKKVDLTEEEATPPPFDMTPYHSRFDFIIPETNYEGDIWYGYDSTSSDTITNFVDKEGFRVEVLATDDLDEANNMRSELRFRLRQNVYIIFDPPFYRVRIGDYETRNAAENQTFKLRQLGYQESRVISDIIKIPEKP
jgi:hypothetical protein